MKNPIYTPKGRALEYGDYALNIYDVCNHSCSYCWARTMYERFHGKGSFDKQPQGRAGLLEALERQLASGAYRDKLIHICFTCDPYPAPPVDTTITREVIKLLKSHGCHVQILTKGGARAERDFDLLDSEDWFGVTLTHNGSTSNDEPRAARPISRAQSLHRAHKRGIKTWASFEPVFEPDLVYDCIENAPYIDLYRIGKLNYHPSDINWGEFGRECERLGKLYEKNIYLKNDLREEMGKK